MTKQEAIDYLLDPIGKREQHDEAIEMAISALQAQNLQPTCNNLATDTISRQAAIDAILREYNKDDSDYPTDYQQGLSATKKIIEQLPSAQLIAFASPDNFTEPKFHPEDWREIL